MKEIVRISANELIDQGLWEAFCNMKGYSPYIVSEGLIDGDHEYVVSKEEYERGFES